MLSRFSSFGVRLEERNSGAHNTNIFLVGGSADVRMYIHYHRQLPTGIRIERSNRPKQFFSFHARSSNAARATSRIVSCVHRQTRSEFVWTGTEGQTVLRYQVAFGLEQSQHHYYREARLSSVSYLLNEIEKRTGRAVMSSFNIFCWLRERVTDESQSNKILWTKRSSQNIVTTFLPPIVHSKTTLDSIQPWNSRSLFFTSTWLLRQRPSW